MKVFIGGSRAITCLPVSVQRKLLAIQKKKYDILVGDCYGIDTLVQTFCKKENYNHVIVFASNGKARNNIGNWPVKNISVNANVRGFEFYKQKDMAMADEADYGFMIWDGRSRGSLNNITNLTKQNKTTLVYLSSKDKMFVIKNPKDIEMLCK